MAFIVILAGIGVGMGWRPLRRLIPSESVRAAALTAAAAVTMLATGTIA
jgi:hypothetical protein